METQKRVNQVAQFEFDVPSRTMAWTFAEGRRIEFTIRHRVAGETDCDYAAMCLGYKQKIVNAAAQSPNPKKGFVPDDDSKANAMQKTVEALRAGVWNRVASGPSNDDLVAAVCQAFGKTTLEAQQEVRKAIGAMDVKTKDALMLEKGVAKALEEVRKSRASAVAPEVIKGMLEQLRAI